MERDTQTAARISLRRIAVATAVVAALLLPSAIGADPGFVPGSHGVAGEVRSNHKGPNDAGGAGGARNLTYHGGPVVHANTTYTIYWGATEAGYQTTINQFFSDVAHDSHTPPTSTRATLSTPTRAARRRMTRRSGAAGRTPRPWFRDHCSGEYAGTGAKVSGCVLDSDLQAEVARARDDELNGWTPAA